MLQAKLATTRPLNELTSPFRYVPSAVARFRKPQRSLYELNLRRWWPPLTWMGAILTATSIPGRFIPAVGFRFTDKMVHVGMYGVLGFLLSRAMDDPAKTTRVRAMFGAFLFCVAMGATDEWHQLYIQGRSAEVADWAADSTGGFIGAATWMLRSRQRAAIGI